MDDRFQFQALVHHQGANAFGAVNLVGRECHGMDAECVEVHRNLAQGLYRIGMHPGLLFARHRGDFGNRLNHAGFVVREHH